MILSLDLVKDTFKTEDYPSPPMVNKIVKQLSTRGNKISYYDPQLMKV